MGIIQEGTQQSTPNFKMEVTAGAFWRELPETVSYEATIPLTYESRWTDSDTQKLKITNDHSTKNNCGFEQECDIMNDIRGLQGQYESEFQTLQESWSLTVLQNMSSTAVRNRRALDFLGEGMSWCCGVATQHQLDSLVMNENSLNEKVEKLGDLLSNSIKTISANSEKFQNYEKGISRAFSETESHMHKLENHFDIYEQKISQYENKYDNYVIDLLRIQYESQKHIIFLSRAMNRQTIMSSCRQHLIPITILNPKVLQSDLLTLQVELKKSFQNLAIPIKHLSKYYQLPLCDCSFTEDKIFVHLRIPICQKGDSWNIFELVTAPFAWKQRTCRIQHEVTFLAVSETEGKVRQISGQGLQHCKPFTDKLCFIPRFSADAFRGPKCAKKLFEGATVEALNHHCPMSCHKSTTTVVTEIEEEVYIITHPKPPTLLLCPGSPEKPIFTNGSTNTGAIKIKIPCNCKLVMVDEEIIPPRFPCRETINRFQAVTHIIPAAWSNLKSFVLNPKQKNNFPTYENHSECINKEWTLQIPHINLTSTQDTVQEIMSKITTIHSPDVHSYSSQGDTIFLIWNTILSIGFIYLFFYNRNTVAVLAQPIQTHALSSSNIVHDIEFSLLCMVFIAFVGYLTVKFVCNCLSKRTLAPSTAVVDIESANEEPARDKEVISHLMVDVDPNKLKELRPGQSMSCLLQAK